MCGSSMNMVGIKEILGFSFGVSEKMDTIHFSQKKKRALRWNPLSTWFNLVNLRFYVYITTLNIYKNYSPWSVCSFCLRLENPLMVLRLIMWLLLNSWLGCHCCDHSFMLTRKDSKVEDGLVHALLVEACRRQAAREHRIHICIVFRLSCFKRTPAQCHSTPWFSKYVQPKIFVNKSICMCTHKP